MVAPQDSQPPEDDPMGPPKVSVEVYCLHCQCVYMSDEIRWKPDPNGPGGGWWVCPIDNCDGKGFTIDIFPTDPEVAKQFGVEYFDDPDDEDDDYEFVDDLDLPDPPTHPPTDTPRRPGVWDDDELPF